MKVLFIQLTISYRWLKETHAIYSYAKFSNPLENSSIINDKNLNERTIEKLLNEVLSTDRQENETRIEQFTEESDI